MNEEKQIEELANSFYEAITHLLSLPTCRVLAKDVIGLGYRKQSEGEWVPHIEIGAMNNFWECSVCHWKTVSFTEMRHSKFCPNCGAKMKGGVE